jgi:hypothetical protein
MKSIIAAALVLCGTVAASAEMPNVGIPGTLNLSTGAFIPEAAKAIEGPTAIAGGVVVFSLSIEVASAITTKTPITCQGTVVHVGLGNVSYAEAASVLATRAGTKASCTVRIPYLWSLGNPNGFVLPQISVSAGERRVLAHSLAPFKLPANNKTTRIAQNLRF